MQIAVLGLGRLGSSLMDKLLLGGQDVVVWNKSKDVFDKLKIDKASFFVQQKIKIGFSIEGMHESLLKPRVFWMMSSGTEEAEQILAEVANIAEPGDLIIDGGPSYFKDTQKRYDELSPKGLKYLGIGVLGGLQRQETGFCLMAGGDKDGYEYLRPVLDSLASPNGGHNYFGTGGAGHFVKMVHDGIENAIMGALSEGLGVLERSTYKVNLIDVSNTWQKGSSVESFLLNTVVKVFMEDPGFITANDPIDVPAEAKWLVEEAKGAHVPIDIISKALEFSQRFEYDKAAQGTFAAKLMAAFDKRLGKEGVKKVGE